jgi:regulator of RNase E activity RraA
VATAVTVLLGSGSPPAGPPRHLGTTAIEQSDGSNVIVVEQRTGVEAGCWGGLLTLGAKVRGVAGVVADGPVRDIDEARDMDFPIFTNKTTSLTARGRVVELGTNVPVTIGAVTVQPGDFVAADDSAVIFIAPENIEAVLQVAEEIVAREAAMADAIRRGVRISQVMGGAYENMLASTTR